MVIMDGPQQGYAMQILRFFKGVPIFYTNNCSAASLQNTGSFATQWPLEHAKFVFMILIFFQISFSTGGSGC
jgi:hypothetical protein